MNGHPLRNKNDDDSSPSNVVSSNGAPKIMHFLFLPNFLYIKVGVYAVIAAK